MKTARKITGFVALVLNLFNLLMFFALRPCWSGTSKTLGYKDGGSAFLYYLPLYLCILLAVIALLCLIFFLAKKDGKVWPFVFAGIGVLFLAANLVIIALGATDYMRFVWPNFWKSVAAVLVILALCFLIFVYPKTSLRDSKAFKYSLLCVLILCAGLILTRFAVNYVSYEPVVYAVEDEYQIVFSTNAQSLASVRVDGQEYYDLYNGSEKSGSLVHKICVPMEVLDRAGGYEISAQRVFYRGPFGGFLGRTIEKSYHFRPVDPSDGIDYFCFSDVHMMKKATLETEKQAGDYDFLVLCGDMISMVDSFADANYANELAFAMTGGEIPVIYARGNHEVKGAYAEQLDRYVGSRNGMFYYTVHLGDIYVIVLDIGEDHYDGWWEFYGTAHYDDYHEDQYDFIRAEFDSGEYKDYGYTLCVSHIPVVYVNYRRDHVDVKARFTELLNQMDLDMAVCGHQHELLIFEPGAVEPFVSPLVYNEEYEGGTYNGYLTDFNFWNLMITAGGFTQPESDDDPASRIGLKIEVTPSEQVCYWLNSRGEKVRVVNPFADIDYGTEIRIPR